jgi:hypothetical protein
MFSHSVVCLFTFFIVVFEEQKVLILMKSNLSIINLVAWALDVYETTSKPTS